MKRRKGETLAEFIIATWIFAMVMTWVVGFITGQTQAFVNLKNRDDIIYCVQKFMNESADIIADGQHYPITAEHISLDISDGGKTLTATKGKDTVLTFKIAP